MEFIELSAEDEESLAQWHRIYLAATSEGREHALPWALEEVRAALAVRVRRWQETRWLGLVDGTPVVSGQLELPMLDNLTHASLEVHVDPAHRRSGHGIAMLSHLESLATAAGRTVLEGELMYPLHEPPDGDWPGIAFARKHGYRFVQEEIQRTQTVPLPEEELDRLAAEAAERHEGYQLETYVGDEEGVEHAAAVAALDATLMVEAPHGDRDDLEPMALDEEAERQTDERRRAQRRTRVRAVALAPDGDVVAYSDLLVPFHGSGIAFQWGTLVRRDHRGHRLGLATKTAALRRLQSHFPEVTSIPTWNAVGNDHMIAVNERLGYRVTERLATWEKRLEPAVSR